MRGVVVEKRVQSFGRSLRLALWLCRAIAAGAAATTVALPVIPASAQALQAEADASVEKGYGRLVLTFKGRNLLPQYVVKSSNGVLVVQFAESVKVDVERVPLTLGNYITVGRRDPDGMALRFALARQVKINTMDAGEKLFIDFLPTNWTGATPPLPESVVQDLAKRADQALKAQREAENLRFGQKIMPKLDFRVGRQPTFSRFSFGWNVPFDTQMQRENDRVVLVFNRPASIDLTSVLADPPPGLKEISADDGDGRLKIVMSVVPEADVRGFREDQTYVVDISAGVRRPPPLAAEALKPIISAKGAIPPAASNRVDLPGASKDMAEAVVAADPTVMTREAPLTAETLPTEGPAPAKAEPKPAPGHAVEPVMKETGLPEPKAMEPKMAEPKAVASKPADPKAATVAPTPKAAEAKPVEPVKKPTAPKVAEEPKAPAAAVHPAPKATQPAEEAKPAQLAATHEPKAPVAKTPVAKTPANEHAPVADPHAPVAAMDPHKPAADPHAPAADPHKGEMPAPGTDDADEAVVANEVIGTGETRPEVRDPGMDKPRLVRIETKRVGNFFRVGFPFAEKTASAAFRRGNSLWLVFDTKLPLDARSVQPMLGPLASAVVVGKVDQSQTLRIDLTQPALTTVTADGNNWFLSIGEMILEPSRPLTLRRQFRNEQLGFLSVDLTDSGMIHDLADPVVGDRILIVTAKGPSRGMLKDQTFAEVQSLSTAHGVAVVPLADDVQVTLDRDVVTISREKGLLLSAPLSSEHSEVVIPRLEGKPKRVAADAKSLFLNKDPLAFNQKLRGLQTAVAEAPEKEKTQKRLELADYYISNRFAPEALGVLRLVANDEPGIERDPGFLVLFGAAQAMTGRLKEAREVLTKPAVLDNADAALWRTIANAGLQRWEDARESAMQAAPSVGTYPQDIQAMFSLAAAEAATELNDFGPAETRLAEIKPDEIDPDLAVRFEVLQARIMDAAGRPDDAMGRLDKAVESPDRRGAAEAEYYRLKVMNRDRKLNPEETIARLKSLGFGWRGDETELKTLRFLAQMQAASGQFRDAFNSMRSAVMVDGNAATTKKLQEEMNREFLSLFLDGKADLLPPIEALSLYYDFRDLTPIGRQGDAIVRNLADRLIGVDLLDQAAELLNYQVNNRLRGVAKAQIAADLAVVHLLNRKPEQALAVINKTRQSSLPASVERQRRLVEARALSESGRGELAMELLGQLVGSDVDRLKADIAWKGKSWRDAGERLETMLAGRWNDKQPLDPQERQDLLRAAIGYALANDQLSLDRLRSKFSKKMADSPNSRAFDVVTAPIQTQGAEFRSIAKEIAAVDTMRSFLDEYRQQYLKGRNPVANPNPKAPPMPAPGSALEKDPKAPEKVAAAEEKKKEEPPKH